MSNFNFSRLMLFRQDIQTSKLLFYVIATFLVIYGVLEFILGVWDIEKSFLTMFEGILIIGVMLFGTYAVVKNKQKLLIFVLILIFLLGLLQIVFIIVWMVWSDHFIFSSFIMTLCILFLLGAQGYSTWMIRIQLDEPNRWENVLDMS
eukprot:TRINITY_DN877_c0_g1_i1.p1 TRINITY_DN877_c0_g1~~TRINITY_DN877_c0_g1_i1.p1  ORF type:complete len:160 (-),score=14.02 TRINITY_DN877_c0_g1_i1:204-647(-)